MSSYCKISFSIFFVCQLLSIIAFGQADTPKSEIVETARGYVKQLQRQMRDPDSFALDGAFRKVLEPQTKEQAKRVGKKKAADYAKRVGTVEFCFEYHSRNGYGGMNRGLAVTVGPAVVPFEQSTLDLIGSSCSGFWLGEKIDKIELD